jgi:hypothetical protein
MTKIKQLILTITFTIIFIICWSFNNAQTQEVICGPRAYMLENMELLDKNTKTLTLMIKGYDWTRFWEFDKTL